MNSNIEKKVINNTDKVKELEAQKEKIQAHINYLDSLINILEELEQKVIELKYRIKNLKKTKIGHFQGTFSIYLLK